MNETIYKEDNSLELESSTVELTPAETKLTEPPQSHKRDARFKYLMLALAILCVFALLMIAQLIWRKSTTKVTETKVTINTQSLDNGTLNTLTNKGDPGSVKQQLTITPDTLFVNNVVVQKAVDIGKSLTVGEDLLVKGKTTLQGAVSVNSSLSVNGSLSVGGSLTAGSLSVGTLTTTTLNLTNDLNIGGHIIPSGAEPTGRTSVAAGGGSVTISGNDTAGTITIKTGSSASSAGELAIITFRKKFSGTPKVQLTPINSSASALDYYATRSVGFFTIDTSSPVAPNAEYVYDYFITQ